VLDAHANVTRVWMPIFVQHKIGMRMPMYVACPSLHGAWMKGYVAQDEATFALLILRAKYADAIDLLEACFPRTPES
jgi:hypothetical protein